MPSAKRSEQDIHAFNILVVDDDEDALDLLTKGLKRKGYMVDGSVDGRGALSSLSQHRYHMAICDINLPDMTGFELMETARDLDPRLEFIIMSGDHKIENAVESITRGAYFFLHKPLSLKVLAAHVEKACQQEGLRSMLGVYEASRAVMGHIGSSELPAQILEAAQKSLGTSHAALMLAGAGGALEVKAATGEGRKAGEILPAGQGDAGRVLKSRRAELLDGAGDDQGRRILYPIMMGDECLGVLEIARAESAAPFTPASMRLVGIFAAQAAYAVHADRLLQRVEEKKAVPQA